MPLLSTKCLERKSTHEADDEVFTIKPLLWKTSDCTRSLHDTALNGNGKISEKNAFVETFKDHDVNIVEKSWRIKPLSFASLSCATINENVINDLIQDYNDHPNIIKIRGKLNFTELSEDFKF